MFSLFNSIKSITNPRDLLDIELVVVQYIYILFMLYDLDKCQYFSDKIQGGSNMTGTICV